MVVVVGGGGGSPRKSCLLAWSHIFYFVCAGNDKTYQRGDLGPYGTTFKVVPMYTDKKGNYQGCWHLRGTKHHPIIPQPAVPNMTDFKVRDGTLFCKKQTI